MERTLSKNEAQVVLDLEWRGQQHVTLAELRSLTSSSASYARFLAHRLVKKGWFERLRRGHYLLISADRGREGVGDTNPLAAGSVLVDPYFYSFGTACTYHGLTEQVFSQIYVACRARRETRAVRETPYVFIYESASRFFGFRELSVLGTRVKMATLERALIDAVDRPECAGGLSEVSRIVYRAANKVTWETLLDFVRRWEQSALVQRLGYLLELRDAHIPEDRLVQLRGLMRP